MYGVHSGMVDSRDEAHGVDEGLPGIALLHQHAAAFTRQAVEPAAPFPGLFDPASLQPPALLQPIKEWIQRCDMELQLTGRARFDQFADLISMSRAAFNDGENH